MKIVKVFRANSRKKPSQISKLAVGKLSICMGFRPESILKRDNQSPTDGTEKKYDKLSIRHQFERRLTRAFITHTYKIFTYGIPLSSL